MITAKAQNIEEKIRIPETKNQIILNYTKPQKIRAPTLDQKTIWSPLFDQWISSLEGKNFKGARKPKNLDELIRVYSNLHKTLSSEVYTKLGIYVDESYKAFIEKLNKEIKTGEIIDRNKAENLVLFYFKDILKRLIPGSVQQLEKYYNKDQRRINEEIKKFVNEYLLNNSKTKFDDIVGLLKGNTRGKAGMNILPINEEIIKSFYQNFIKIATTRYVVLLQGIGEDELQKRLRMKAEEKGMKIKDPSRLFFHPNEMLYAYYVLTQGENNKDLNEYYTKD